MDSDYIVIIIHYLFLFLSLSTLIASSPTFYGYIGPSCAVVHDTLYIHGVSVRQLNPKEISEFRQYQDANNRWNEADWIDEKEPAPLLPDFCQGFDDSTEVVLKDCIIRNEHLYVDGKVRRPLDAKERQRIRMLIARRTKMYRGRLYRGRHRRYRRSSSQSSPISDVLDRFLRLNTSVTSRFVPLVSQSPLFASLSPLVNPESVSLPARPPLLVAQIHEPRLVISPSPSHNSDVKQQMTFNNPLPAPTTPKFHFRKSTIQRPVARSIYLPPLPNTVRVAKEKEHFEMDSNLTGLNAKHSDRESGAEIDCDVMKRIAEALAKEDGLFEQLPSLVRSDLQLPGCSMQSPTTSTNRKTEQMNYRKVNKETKEKSSTERPTSPPPQQPQDYYLPNDICLRL